MSSVFHDTPSLVVPLILGNDGAVRLTGTRIPLAVLLEVVQQGHTPEQIASEIFDVSVGDIYAVLAWVHHHKDEVEAYLAEHEREAAEFEARARTHEAPGLERLRRLAAARRP